MRRNEAGPGVLRRLWRDVYWFRSDRRIRAEYRGVSHLVYFGGSGLGDEMLVTTVLHELRRRGGTGLGVMTTSPELFAHSPDVDLVKPMRYDHTAFLQRVGIRADHLNYIQRRLPPDVDVPPPRHLLAEMCRLAGITGEVHLRPYLYHAEVGPAKPRWRQPYVVMQSSRRSASLEIANKEWVPGRFQAVADALRQDFPVVQIGQTGDPPLAGADDLRGCTSLRETAAVLSGAAVFVGLVGFLMHLARAVDCPALIVYGGRERPDQSGYVKANLNLYSPLPCAPCWRWNSCDFDRRCMVEITVEHVLSSVRTLLSVPPPRPLPVDTAEIAAEPTAGI